MSRTGRFSKRGLILSTLVAVLVFIAINAHDAKSMSLAGNPQKEKQPVVGFAYSSNTCANVGDPMQIVNVLTNQSTAVHTVVVWQYGISKGSDMDMKGPTIDVNTRRSDLSTSPDRNIWYWRVMLQPGQSTTRTLYVNHVSPGYYAANWPSAWGPNPWPRFYTGATGYMKGSRVQFTLFTQTPYCTLDGSIPYTIPEPPVIGK